MLYLHAHFKIMVITFLALLVSIIPFPFGSFFIPWFLTFVFLWQCNNDYYFNPVFIFFTGLIFDFFSGGVLGLTSLLMLIFFRIIYNNRFILRGQTLQIKWLVFFIFLLMFLLIQYLILSLIELNFLDLWPSLISLILMSITYPVFRIIFTSHNE